MRLITFKPKRGGAARIGVMLDATNAVDIGDVAKRARKKLPFDAADMVSLIASGKTGLDYACWGRSDPVTGVALADSARITEDKNFTVRAWGAVVTYLLSDWKFTHQ
jgi:hypothetical protein